MSDSRRQALIDHLMAHAVRTDGPFVLSSGAVSSWYIDARRTTFDGVGAAIVGAAVADVLPEDATAVGGLTMGADPVAVATAMTVGAGLKAFSVRRTAKRHGTGGRIVGPVGPGDRAVLVEDTTTTGSSFAEAAAALEAEGIAVVAAVALVDRSDGAVTEMMRREGRAYLALTTPADLGVE